jgi:2-succinyl-5-enolpyruvyl-6-hydroxy-3-cyclohexene-1-carboxylate synthase
MAAQVADAVEFEAPGDPTWWTRWRQADQALTAGLSELLAGQPWLTGPALAAALWAGLGAADVLVAGSSNPIRDLDLAPISDQPPTVYANRGLAGIDGTVSTAAGVALASGRPTHALLGDLTALHDLTGLLVGPAEPRPDLRLVVANDDGGSIFATLEQGSAERAATFERLFGTPTRADFSGLAAATGADYRRVESAADLEAILSRPPRGIQLVEAVVDRTGRRDLDLAVTALAATL